MNRSFSTVVLILAILIDSCAVIDLSELTTTTRPEKAGDILAANSEIRVSFSKEMDRIITEEVVSLSNFTSKAIVQVDKLWQSDTDLVLRPVGEALSPGTRYVLEIRGSVQTASGINYSLDEVIPFHYVHNEGFPELASYFPEEFTVVGISDALWFDFSSPIDQARFKDEFVITPQTELDYVWSNQGQRVTIQPKQQWEQFTRYSWTISEKTRAQDETPLLRAYSGSFLVQEDSIPPEVATIAGGEFVNGVFTADSVLNTLTSRSSIRFTFSEPIDSQSFEPAFSIVPSINGQVFVISTEAFVFYPFEDWNQETEYILVIEKEIEDLSGNSMTEEFRRVFAPFVLPIEVDRIVGDPDGANEVTITVFNTAAEHQLIPDIVEHDYRIRIELSGDYASLEARNRLVAAISFIGYLPPIGNPVLKNVMWNDDRTVILVYEDFSSASGPEPWNKQLYLFQIGSGSTTKNDNGQYLSEDANVIFSAQ